MTQRPYRPEPSLTLEQRAQVRPMAIAPNPIFQGWGPKF
jgi:hypothetical protein